MVDTPSRYVEVRSLERGLQLLQALAEMGFSSPARLAQETGIDRTTVYRLLATLRHCGFVQQQQDGGGFGLTGKIVELASGVHQQDEVVSIIAPILDDLVRTTSWPSDFAAIFGGRLRILASTHHKTSMTFFRRMTGKDRPILLTSLGHAILAAVNDAEREAILLSIGSFSTVAIDSIRRKADHIVSTTRRNGYALAVSTFDPKISAIALPIEHADQVLGAINLVFFRTAMSADAAVDRYLPDMTATVARIQAGIGHDVAMS